MPSSASVPANFVPCSNMVRNLAFASAARLTLILGLPLLGDIPKHEHHAKRLVRPRPRCGAAESSMGRSVPSRETRIV